MFHNFISFATVRHIKIYDNILHISPRQECGVLFIHSIHSSAYLPPRPPLPPEPRSPRPPPPEPRRRCCPERPLPRNPFEPSPPWPRLYLPLLDPLERFLSTIFGSSSRFLFPNRKVFVSFNAKRTGSGES
mmetsp:Transcript_7845/g.14264  ORF Transcript_7845/g.14264 Transcript_7845/m.14264 type:complete len:131 (-) Transcript_7845:1147-1539(-)